jgi:hypothetical protein
LPTARNASRWLLPTLVANNPAAVRLRGKRVDRETSALLKQYAQAAAFKKMTWENAHQVFNLPF